MIKKFLAVILLIVGFLLPANNVLAVNNTNSISNNTAVTVNEYQKNIKEFKAVDADQADQLFAKNDNIARYLYVGRPTCYYCRQFSKTLKDFNHLIGGNLYYLNIDLNQDAEDYAINNLEIPGTPSVIQIKNGEIVKAWVGGGKTSQELYDFFNNN